MKYAFSLGFREERLLGFTAVGPEALPQQPDVPKVETKEQIKEPTSVKEIQDEGKKREEAAEPVAKLAAQQIDQIKEKADAAAGINGQIDINKLDEGIDSEEKIKREAQFGVGYPEIAAKQGEMSNEKVKTPEAKTGEIEKTPLTPEEKEFNEKVTDLKMRLEKLRNYINSGQDGARVQAVVEFQAINQALDMEKQTKGDNTKLLDALGIPPGGIAVHNERQKWDYLIMNKNGRIALGHPQKIEAPAKVENPSQIATDEPNDMGVPIDLNAVEPVDFAAEMNKLSGSDKKISEVNPAEPIDGAEAMDTLIDSQKKKSDQPVDFAAEMNKISKERPADFATEMNKLAPPDGKTAETKTGSESSEKSKEGKTYLDDISDRFSKVMEKMNSKDSKERMKAFMEGFALIGELLSRLSDKSLLKTMDTKLADKAKEGTKNAPKDTVEKAETSEEREVRLKKELAELDKGETKGTVTELVSLKESKMKEQDNLQATLTKQHDSLTSEKTSLTTELSALSKIDPKAEDDETKVALARKQQIETRMKAIDEEVRSNEVAQRGVKDTQRELRVDIAVVSSLKKNAEYLAKMVKSLKEADTKEMKPEIKQGYEMLTSMQIDPETLSAQVPSRSDMTKLMATLQKEAGALGVDPKFFTMEQLEKSPFRLNFAHESVPQTLTSSVEKQPTADGVLKELPADIVALESDLKNELSEATMLNEKDSPIVKGAIFLDTEGDKLVVRGNVAALKNAKVPSNVIDALQNPSYFPTTDNTTGMSKSNAMTKPELETFISMFKGELRKAGTANYKDGPMGPVA